jgi:hypothetical protein
MSGTIRRRDVTTGVGTAIISAYPSWEPSIRMSCWLKRNVGTHNHGHGLIDDQSAGPRAVLADDYLRPLEDHLLALARVPALLN